MDSPSEDIFKFCPQPFLIFRVDEDTLNEQIEDARSAGQGPRSASTDFLRFEREARLNPAERLSYELRCPIDCPHSELDALYAKLSDASASTEELLLFADRLWPLSRANFVAHVASHRPASAALLYALLESHAAIDPNALYAKLKLARTTAGIPAPSWASVHQGLDDLLDIHCSAVFAGYDMIESALDPVLECARQILGQRERHLVGALGSLLRSYQRFVAILRNDAAEQIASACVALREQPRDASVIDRLAVALQSWMSASQPLLMWNINHAGHELGLDTPVKELRALIADLAEKRRYEVASKITDLARDLFRAVPTTIDQLVEDARLLEDLSRHTAVARLENAVNDIESDPNPLIAALETDGFGPASIEPAARLFASFVRAASANRQAQDTPWKLTHDFAIRLSNRPEAAVAVVRLIAGLIEYGESVSAAPQFLRELRDNLSFMKSFIGTEPVEANIVAAPTPKMKSSVRDFFWKRSSRKTFEDRGRRRYRSTALAFLIAVACGFAALEFDKAHLIWSKLWGRTPANVLSAETMPPVGSGQHLDLNGVRYCRFQQERLRFIKQLVQGPEDTRAYNLLIVDYNSRCSDFFYQDNDLKTVLSEVGANKSLLEADAKRIVSAWPGHTAKN